MTLQQLEYILALDKHRHYVRAAEEKFVSQPNLTMQIKKLEDEIGIKIFDRDSKPIKPTTAGEQVLSKSRQILNDVNDLKEFVSNEKNTISGEYIIGVIPTIAPYLLPLFLPSFLENNKKTKLIIREMQTKNIIADLKSGKIDVGILATPLDEKQIREIPIFNEQFLLYVNDSDKLFNKSKISISDLNRENLLLLDEGHCFREQTLAICKDLGTNNSNFEFSSGSIEALVGLVDKGLGYTLVPELAVINKKSNNIRKFNDESVPVREVSLVTNNNFTKEKLIDELHKVISESIPEKLPRKRKYFRVEWK
jgi:LysR family hydrogen peroxide-inducible transcriptional activator